MLHQVNISDTDVLIVELPKSGDDYVFQPMKSSANEEEKNEAFQDPLSNVSGASTDID